MTTKTEDAKSAALFGAAVMFKWLLDSLVLREWINYALQNQADAQRIGFPVQ